LSFFNFDRKIALGLIVLAFIIKGFVTFFALWKLASFQGKVLFTLKTQMFSVALNSSYLRFTSKSSGHYVNLINEQSIRAQSVFHHLNQAGITLVQAIVLTIVGFISSWGYALFLIISTIIIIFIFNFLNSYVSKISDRYSQFSSKVSQKSIEYLSFWKYFVASGRADTAILDYTKKCRTLIFDYIKMATAGHFTASIREPIAVLVVSILILYELNSPDGSVASIIISLALFYRAMNNFLAFQQARQGVYDNIGAVRMLNAEFTFIDKEQYTFGKENPSSGPPKIIFENVSFNYENRKALFNELNLVIEPGTLNSIIGSSGSGKSTVAALLTGLLKPKNGRIIINDKSLDKLNILSWREKIGYLTQDNVIIEGTILENISMKANDVNLTEMDKVINAAKQAVILDFINSLPNKFDTLVGDKGFNLSGGQKQRLAIAREIYRDVDVLLLDEPSSALDIDSEDLLCKTLSNLRMNKTLICITHSKRILDISDKIIKVD